MTAVADVFKFQIKWIQNSHKHGSEHTFWSALAITVKKILRLLDRTHCILFPLAYSVAVRSENNHKDHLPETPPAHRALLSAKINSTKAALWIMKISTQKNLQAAVKWQLLWPTQCKTFRRAGERSETMLKIWLRSRYATHVGSSAWERNVENWGLYCCKEWIHSVCTSY